MTTRRVATRIAFLMLGLLVAHSAVAQDRGGGRGGFDPRSGGGFRGGEGGFQGRGEGGFGGGMSSFLVRLDSNGNGLLDPPEMEGRARFMLERFAADLPGFDFSRPYPIDRLARAIEQRMQGDGGRGGDRGDDRGRSSGRSGGGGSQAVSVEPLVPGFGVPDAFAPVPGFGSLGEQFAVTISDEDREEAQRTLSRNDRNGDGILDAEEIRQGRWSADPMVQDRNRDGRLTESELAVRYAMRRTNEEENRSSRSSSDRSRSSRSTPSRSNNDSSASRPSENEGGGFDRMTMMVQGMFSRFDRNGSGMLERDEWSGLQGDASGADRNSDGRISREELSEWLSSRFSRGGGDERSSRGRGGFAGFGGGSERGFDRGAFSRGDGERRGGEDEGSGRSRFFSRDERGGNDGEERAAGSPAVASAPGTSASSRTSYRTRPAVERLPEDLPSWFAAQDQNRDGQVMMVEYVVSWTDSAAAEFEQFDLNGDGIITAQECLTATENGVVRGAGVSSTSSLVARADDSGRSGRRSRDEGRSSGSTRATAATSSNTGGGDDGSRYIAYAVNYIKQFDTNGDGVLDADEWSKMTTDYSAGDTDGDGKLTPTELAAEMMKR